MGSISKISLATRLYFTLFQNVVYIVPDYIGRFSFRRLRCPTPKLPSTTKLSPTTSLRHTTSTQCPVRALVPGAHTRRKCSTVSSGSGSASGRFLERFEGPDFCELVELGQGDCLQRNLPERQHHDPRGSEHGQLRPHHAGLVLLQLLLHGGREQ